MQAELCHTDTERVAWEICELLKQNSGKEYFVHETGDSQRPDSNLDHPIYEERLNRDSRWALREGSVFFEGKSAVQETLRNIAAQLNELSIDYAVVGGMALFHYGFRRFTEDVDILVTREGLKEIHEKLEGRGYVPPFNGSKNLRDTEHGVKIEFLVAGEFPGDGKPKPVSFPDPSEASIESDGIYFIGLPELLELKIASGMTNLQRLKDLVDVQQLISLLALDEDYAEKLNPYVRGKYLELWQIMRPQTGRYILLWKNNGLPEDAKQLVSMLTAGIKLDLEGEIAEGWTRLLTTDPELARKYGMHEEAEFLDIDSVNGPLHKP